LQNLRSIGVELVEGDLKDRASLDAACKGIKALISPASMMVSRQPDDTVEQVDHLGQQNLVEAARATGAEHLLYVSFSGHIDRAFPFPASGSNRAPPQRVAVCFDASLLMSSSSRRWDPSIVMPAAVACKTPCLYLVSATVPRRWSGSSQSAECKQHRARGAAGIHLAVLMSGPATSRRRMTARVRSVATYGPYSKERIMNTQGTVAVNASRKAVYDKVESQIHTFEAQLATLKAKAESAKADAELKAIANLVTAKRTLDQKVAELKIAGEAAFQQAKADVEARIAEFEKSVKAIESKIREA
jgi:NAD(P)H-binding